MSLNDDITNSLLMIVVKNTEDGKAVRTTLYLDNEAITLETEIPPTACLSKSTFRQWWKEGGDLLEQELVDREQDKQRLIEQAKNLLRGDQ